MIMKERLEKQKQEYEVTIKGQTIPYILKSFDTKKDAKDFIEVLKEQDKVLGCCLEYVIKEFEVYE